MSRADWPGHVRQWFDALPDGIASYPECQVKAAVWRELSSGFPEGLADAVQDLPAEARALVSAPPPPSTWIPEVHANLAASVAADRLFDGWQAFYRYTYEMNRRLMGGPLYRVLLRLISPDRILKGSALAYGQMHRGSKAKAQREGDTMLFTLRYPDGLFPSDFTRAFPTAIRATLELAGEHHVHATIQSEDPTHTTYAVLWDND